jgi:predicted LPLAT superfamily acyltransferase
METDRWTRISESGTARALRVGGWLLGVLGRRTAMALLWLPSLYYLVRSRERRRGSRQYLERLCASPEGRAALGRRPGPMLVLRHIHEFATSLYDRLLVWTGALDELEVEHDGSEAIFELARSGRGAILLGAHLGSLDMLWFLSRKYDLRVTVVVFFQNAERVNAFFESMSPDAAVRVIDLDPQSVRAAFEIKACIERGEFVVILADRVAPGKAGRVEEVQFLGRPAAFPLAPFLLAGVLGCPVLLALCLRIGDGRYRTVLRSLGDAGRVPRDERDKRARELLERYTAQLESFCLAAPLQWFNFYEFWEEA